MLGFRPEKDRKNGRVIVKDGAMVESFGSGRREIINNVFIIALGAATSAAKQLDTDLEIVMYKLAASLNEKAVMGYSNKDS